MTSKRLMAGALGWLLVTSGVVAASFLSIAAATAAPAASPAPATATGTATTGGPRETLKQLNGNVDKHLRKKTIPDTEEDRQTKQLIKVAASELLDYTELCKRALGDHWGKMPEKTRTEFVATLQELIERNYVRQLRTNLDYEVTYKDETVADTEATVLTTIKIRTKGKSTDASIDYKMIKKERGWRVYDVITDEVSLVRNYRSQFQRIINGSGYDGLLNKMKTKLTEEKEREAKEDKEKAEKAAAKKG